jgi:NADH-quinone oxidoreductase subunit E
VKAGETLLNTLLAAQEAEGCLTRDALGRIAKEYGTTFGRVYEAAGFYSMLRFEPGAKVLIQICRNAPCHVAGSAETVAAFEKALGIKIGDRTPDGAFELGYTECIGQCQGSPSILINGEVYTDVTPDRVTGLLALIASH